MSRFNKIVLNILTFIFIAISFGCGNNKANDKQIVASWKNVAITLSDFERSYFNSWQMKGIADSPQLRKQIARELIEKQLIVEVAEKTGIIDESLFENKLKRDYERILRRRYLEATVKDTITPPTNEELRQKLLLKNKSVKASQLFTKSPGEIQKIHKRLSAGEDFENIVNELNTNPKSNIKSGNINWVKWDEVDINLEKALFSLKENEISKPVQSLIGWHIFRVDSIQYTIQFNSDTDSYTLTNLHHQIINRKLEIAGANHIRNILWNKSLEINAKLFNKVWAFISPNLPDSKQEIMLSGFSKLENSYPDNDLGNEVIAKVDGLDFTVNELLYAFPELPRDLHKPNLRWAIETAIRNKILTEEAIDKGFDKDDVVREKYQRAEILYKYYAAMAYADSVQNHKVNLVEYYNSNKSKYVESVESDIETILVKDKNLALELAKRIYNGEDFAKIKKENCIEQSENKLTKVSSLNSLLGKKAANLNEGDIYAPINSPEGFYIIRVSQQKKNYKPYEKIKQQLARDAQANYYVDIHNKLLPNEYKASEINFNNENLKIAFTNKSSTIF